MIQLSYDVVERAVARTFNISQASLFSMPDDSKMEDAISLLFIMCREKLKVSTDEIIERYSFVSKSGLLNRICGTYEMMEHDDRLKGKYSIINQMLS